MVNIDLEMKSENGAGYKRRLWMEFGEWIDPRLRAVLTELAWWLFKNYVLTLVVTCLNRSNPENTAVGGRKWSSHLTGRAADLRSKHFTEEIREAIINHLQETWGADFLHVIWHDSGKGEHFHLNINRAFMKRDFTEGEFHA